MKLVEVIKLDKTDLTQINQTVSEMFNTRSLRTEAKDLDLIEKFSACTIALSLATKRYSDVVLAEETKDAFTAALGHKEAWEKTRQIAEGKENPVLIAEAKNKKSLWFKSIKKAKEAPAATEMAVRKHYKDVATEHAANYMKSISRALA